MSLLARCHSQPDQRHISTLKVYVIAISNPKTFFWTLQEISKSPILVCPPYSDSKTLVKRGSYPKNAAVCHISRQRFFVPYLVHFSALIDAGYIRGYLQCRTYRCLGCWSHSVYHACRQCVHLLQNELFFSHPKDTPWDEPTEKSPEFRAYLDGSIFREDPWNRLPSGPLGYFVPSPTVVTLNLSLRSNQRDATR